jgi:NitT/TauT family transport system substrate-binding protein
MAKWFVHLLCMAVLLTGGCRKIQTSTRPPGQVRLGYFGNLTHAQAVLGVSSGEFAGAIQPAVLKTKVFNAGPSLIEALLAGEIDIGYVGPGPALNAHVKGHGTQIRVVAGAAENGVLIVARNGSGIEKFADLAGKRIASPQYGNTQDIAARYYLTHGLHQANSDNVLAIPNADQAQMMKRKQIDAAWVPQPWGSRLVSEAGAHVVGEEKDLWPDKEFALTLVVTTPEFLANHPDILEKILKIHHQWTVRLKQNPQKYVPELGDALFAVNGSRLKPGVVASAIKSIQFTDDPLPASLKTMADWAYDLDFSSKPADLSGLVEMRILDDVIRADAGHSPTTQPGNVRQVSG